MFEPEELMARIVDLEEQLKVSEMAPPAAEQLIACLEGEISKRDEELAACRVAVENCELFRARIAELEHRCGMYGLELTNEVERRLQAERQLSALKAQELAESDYYRSMLRAVLKDIRDEIPRGGLPQSWNDIADSISVTLSQPIYAAPVVSAEQQGVADLRALAAPVQQVSVPDEREAFEKWGETLFYTACFERHENDEYVGRGLQGAWLGWKARAALGCEPARLCVFPDGWRLVPNEPTLDMGWAYVDAANEATPRKRNSFSHSGYRAMLDVAPTAPTAESGLVEALITVAHWHLPETGQFWPSGAPVSYEAQYGSNGARDYMRGVAQAALAAHRAKGVV